MSDKKFLICSDMDGTLLTTNKKVSFFTKLYIRYLQKKGNIFVITTGRPIRTSIKYYNELKLNGPMINHNGALITYPKNIDKCDEIKYIDKEIILDVYNKFKNNIIENVLLETKDNIYFDKRDNFIFKFFENDNHKEFSGDLNETLKEDTITFIIHLGKKTEEEKNELANYVKEKFSNVEISFWGYSEYCDLHLKETNKSLAIKKIAKQYNIDSKHIITFGDSMNDIKMVTDFENGYAMKNGIETLLKQAKNITKKDNNHNGVAFELIRIIRNLNN